MDKDDKFKMVYRYLGNTGMKVSLLSFGTMLVDYTPETEQAWIDCADHAFKAGINYFDSAEMYGAGKGDILLGRAIKELNWRREDLVVSVKMFGGRTPNTNGLSRKKIIESCKKSLKSMDLEYCDIVFAHRWETETPLEETCRAFNWLIKKGFALYWATSAWPEELIIEAIKICDKHGWYRPVADQCEYNCLVREHVETSYRRIFKNYGYGTTIWSPLGGGFLTGKYNDATIPEGSRYKENEMFKNFAWDKYIGADGGKHTLKLLKGLADLAEELKCTQAQLALAWTLVNKDVSSCIIGASRLSQLQDNLKALDIAANWTEEFEERINKILDNEPAAPVNWLTWTPYSSRRKERLNTHMELGKVQYRELDHTQFD
jgi:voltage-dependent potassium channel beta subunit